jgi:hypothetical protein
VISAEVMRALVAAGATSEMLIAAVEADQAIDAARLAAKRAKDAERQRRNRARTSTLSRGLPVTDVTPLNVPPHPPITTPSSEEASASSGATAPQALPGQPEIKDRIWLELPAPLAVLGGKTEAQVRTFLGKALKVHDPPAVYTAGLAALQSKSGDPFAYIVRVLAPTAARKNTHAGKAESLSDRARSIADKLRAAEQSVPPIGGGGPGGYPPRLLSDRRGG